MTFRNRILTGAFLILFAGASLAHAGAMVVTEFKAGSQKGREALSHLTNKGVVTEFLDLSNTGAGKSVGFLIWREILTAISDQAGAGVIIAHMAGEERVVDMLKANYHLAAVDIAKHQNSPMVLWGIAQETDDKIFISNNRGNCRIVVGGDRENLDLITGTQRMYTPICPAKINIRAVTGGGTNYGKVQTLGITHCSEFRINLNQLACYHRKKYVIV